MPADNSLLLMLDGYSRLNEVLDKAKARGVSLRKWAVSRGLDPAIVVRLRSKQIVPNLRVALILHVAGVSIFSWREIVEEHRRAA